MFQNFVYIIKGSNINNKIKYYIGFTKNLEKRIRQHNRIIKGGAKATFGYTWSYYAIFANIPSMNIGLQIEWRLKNTIKLKNKKILQKYIENKTNSNISNISNISTKINLFFAYIDCYLCPNNNRNEILTKKLFCYISSTDQLITPKYILIMQFQLNEIIIKHINNS
jgi:predicted GIY-YIG superfamily endonuclease